MAVKKKSIGTGKKTTAEKAAAIANKKTAIAEKQTKTEIIATICEETGLSRKDVQAVFNSAAGLVERHLKPRGSGEFTVPEIGAKIKRVTKKAQKARKMISPFTGEEIQVKAKPARKAVKITPTKALKDMVG